MGEQDIVVGTCRDGAAQVGDPIFLSDLSPEAAAVLRAALWWDRHRQTTTEEIEAQSAELRRTAFAFAAKAKETKP